MELHRVPESCLALLLAHGQSTMQAGPFAEGGLRNWNSAGRGPAPVGYGTSTVRYLPEDVEEWVRSQREPMLV